MSGRRRSAGGTTLIGLIALVEALALSIDARRWPIARTRFETIEAVRSRLEP